MNQTPNTEGVLNPDEELNIQNTKPHVPDPVKKVSKFGNQGMSKFGK